MNQRRLAPTPSAPACDAPSSRSAGLRVALASGITGAALIAGAALAGGESPLARAAQAAEPDGFQAEFDLASRRLADSGEGRYFVMRPGYQTVLASEPTVSGGLRRLFGRLVPRAISGRTVLTITVLDETKEVAGVLTRVVEEREEDDGQLHEIARNYYAIDPPTGDAFYFGEDVDFYENGRVVDHAGSWLAGGSNRPGLIMAGAPRGRHEVLPGAGPRGGDGPGRGGQHVRPAARAGWPVRELPGLRETSPLEPSVVEHKYLRARHRAGAGRQALKLVSSGDVPATQRRG